MIKFRPFEWADSAFVKEVLMEVQDQYQAIAPGYMKGLCRYIDQRNLEPFGAIRIIELDGRAVGWLGEKIRCKDPYLGHFYMKQIYQGQGLGSRALGFYKRTQRNLGHAWLRVDASKEMSHVMRFYRQLGFTPVENREDAKAPQAMEQFVQMACRL